MESVEEVRKFETESQSQVQSVQFHKSANPIDGNFHPIRPLLRLLPKEAHRALPHPFDPVVSAFSPTRKQRSQALFY